MITLRYFHWTYVWIPIIGAIVWSGTLLAMLITWLVSGRPQYESQEGTIAYISDIGADFLKPLFVTSCSITAACFTSSLMVERWLRHSGRLVPIMRRRERVYSILSMFWSVVGGAGLILLSVFDTMRYPTHHRLFLLVFLLGVVLSAIFTVIEYRWISKDYDEERYLRKAYAAKAIIAGVLIVLAIAFAVAMFHSYDVGAILEWVIAFGFTSYIITFYFDLRQSKNMRKGEFSATLLPEEAEGSQRPQYKLVRMAEV